MVVNQWLSMTGCRQCFQGFRNGEPRQRPRRLLSSSSWTSARKWSFRSQWCAMLHRRNLIWALSVSLSLTSSLKGVILFQLLEIIWHFQDVLLLTSALWVQLQQHYVATKLHVLKNNLAFPSSRINLGFMGSVSTVATNESYQIRNNDDDVDFQWLLVVLGLGPLVISGWVTVTETDIWY